MNLPAQYTAWLDAMHYVARHYGIGVSQESVRASLAWERGAPLDTLLDHMARQLGLALRLDAFSVAMLDPWRLPLVVEFDNGEVGVVRAADGRGMLGVLLGGDQGLETAVPFDEVRRRAKRVAILRPNTAVADVRVDDYIKPYRANWFWTIVLRDWRRYGDIVLASVFANMLALASTIFSMQIYDRVVPAQSESTLWVLFGGVMLAVAFEFLLRMSRTHISDVIGKRADLKVSDLVFGHALRVRSDARSKSTGSFIAQVREVEQVRELLTSTTISAVVDLPFFLLFLGVLWLVAGPLTLVALAAVPLLVIPGLLIQKPLARLANEGMRESALRNALLVEAVEGIEDIKLMRAEPRFQNQWNHANDVAAGVSMRQRFLTSLLMTWTQEVQTIVYAVVLLAGCYLVMKGDMTTGALVGSSILASRMIAPLAQLSGVFARWQQAKVARAGLDQLMLRPVDQPERARRVHVPSLRGSYNITGVEFRYNKDDRYPAFAVAQLQVRPGEKIALLGRMGAGKSTLLQLMAGLQTPQRGHVGIDSLDISLVDPADLRRDLGLLTQNARLFHGSIRDNVTMGRPLATDDEVVQALAMAGALPFVQSRHEGLGELIHEGGLGLSGGQRQALLLARTLIRQPSVVLLDEPTAHFDEFTEHQVIESMGPWLASRTLVVATHRMPVLRWVDRIVVIDSGRIVMDGSKDRILGELSRGNA
ncbi:MULTISPECIES: type I secretion system permease/ATPase [unclassified Variovorax]|jgi:ATP-binding cassette subfamily C protein LapB|uniref:type I secretion system permease/ATPase n=1 Tax=unclassified Variovorax TaxID=663243 RepID=UPI000F7F4828|nr:MULTISPECIES: type I secretion system permease/ATPase [unclassified Variovorax]RSZ43769.1 type I secretion system permease/ATPase [Variovorax sp. 553]RSZ45574.1 type I secretion system permease/ATPase [Variovorax sp. 679]